MRTGLLAHPLRVRACEGIYRGRWLCIATPACLGMAPLQSRCTDSIAYVDYGINGSSPPGGWRCVDWAPAPDCTAVAQKWLGSPEKAARLRASCPVSCRDGVPLCPPQPPTTPPLPPWPPSSPPSPTVPPAPTAWHLHSGSRAEPFSVPFAVSAHAGKLWIAPAWRAASGPGMPGAWQPLHIRGVNWAGFHESGAQCTSTEHRPR